MTFGDKFNVKDCNDAIDHFYIDDQGNIYTESIMGMITGKGDNEG